MRRVITITITNYFCKESDLGGTVAVLKFVMKRSLLFCTIAFLVVSKLGLIILKPFNALQYYCNALKGFGKMRE